MESTSATINVTRELPHPAESVFAHWISPETRLRWEAGPDSGMTYDAFDTREGGVETVRIIQDGKEIGHMFQNTHRLVEGRLMAYSLTGVFGGVLTTLMQIAIEFQPTDEGCRLEATAQVIDLTGGDVQSQHEAGWDWILDRFEADIAEHGLVTG